MYIQRVILILEKHKQMKKNLLTIGFLVLFVGLSKAQVLTYVDSGAKLYVGSSALVYSGGDFQLNSANSATVENKGNITEKKKCITLLRKSVISNDIL